MNLQLLVQLMVPKPYSSTVWAAGYISGYNSKDGAKYTQYVLNLRDGSYDF